MSRKTMIIILIFVVLAGAIAGAFVFLNQAGMSAPTALPSVSGRIGGTTAHQGMLPFGGTSGIGFTVPGSGAN